MTTTTEPTPTVAVVKVEEPWYSKINWAAMITLVAAILSIWGIKFPPEAQNALLNLIVAVSQVITLVGPVVIIAFRTWFTKSVTPQAVQKQQVPTIEVPPVSTGATAFISVPNDVAADLRR